MADIESPALPGDYCGCRWCAVPAWIWPTVAAVVVPVLLALIGGGRYPWLVDVGVYLATGTMAYVLVTGAVMRRRVRHDDRARDERHP